MGQTATINAPDDLVLAEGTFRLSLPTWGRWLDILDRAARGQSRADRADPDRLMQAWLSSSVTQADAHGDFHPIKQIADLPATLADTLMAAGTDALETARGQDCITTVKTLQTFEVNSENASYFVRPLSFSERNACLQGALALTEHGPEINASQYELTLVARSVTDSKTGEHLPIPTLRDLSIPLGEALIAAARELSDPAAQTELAAFAAAGMDHPDLELATLCLTYGMSPSEAAELPAATAKRLNAAARLLAATAPAPATTPQMTPMADNVTQIVINDD